jgi:hypothetical protein
MLLVGPGGALRARINGQAVELRLAGKAGNYWDAYPLPPEVLKPGRNEIILHGGGRVWIARAEDFAAGSTSRPRHPGRNARGSDSAATCGFLPSSQDAREEGKTNRRRERTRNYSDFLLSMRMFPFSVISSKLLTLSR